MTKIRGIALALAVVGFCAVARPARADAPGDAWAAAKGRLSGTPYVVMGANMTTIKSSQIFQKLYPMLLDKSPDFKTGVDQIKTTCGFDVNDVVQGGVVAIDDTEKGVMFFSLKGLDQAKVTDCITKISTVKDATHKITASKPDRLGIVEYKVKGDPKKLYVAFLPKGVVAMATEPFDKALLKKSIGGKGVSVKSETGKALAAVNANAAMWMVVTKAQQVDNINMKVIYGSADFVSGSITGDLHVVLASAQEATDAVTKGQAELNQAKKSGQIPPMFNDVMKSLTMVAAGSEVQVKASITEKSVLALLQMVMP